MRFTQTQKASTNWSLLSNHSLALHTVNGAANCVLCFIRVWSLFCSVRVYISLHFPLILFVKLGFRLYVFWFFIILFLWCSVFIFHVVSQDLKSDSHLPKKLLFASLKAIKNSLKMLFISS